MKNRQQQSEAFFSAYEKRFNDSLQDREVDMDEVAACFAECFVESSPAGVICGKNDSALKEKMKEGFLLYKKIGTKAMHIEAKEIVPIDEMHDMCTVSWKYTAVRKDDGKEIVIRFKVSYMLRAAGEGLQIFAYVTGDEQKVLKENGLI